MKKDIFFESYEVIARWIIDKAIKEDVSITHLKLQKLIYICYGWVLGGENKKLFQEDFYAWQHGPVLKEMYNHVGKRGKDNLCNSKDFKANNSDLKKELNKIFWLDYVWERYKNISAYSLSQMTHNNGTPWSVTNHGNIIAYDLIKNYYQKIISLSGIKEDSEELNEF